MIASHRQGRSNRPLHRPEPDHRQGALVEPRAFERVRARAYEIFLARARDTAPGDELSDWLQAEREVAEASTPSRPRARGETLLHDPE